MRALPSWLTRQPAAHRGLHDASAGVPENSLAAFEAAIRAGYAIELDLQLSADGIAMVFHDDDLMRLGGEAGAMAERTAAALGRVRLLGTPETIPTLRQTLDRVAGRTPLLIELKTLGQPAGPLEAATWGELRRYRGPYAVQSFNPRTVAWFANRAPQVCRGQITAGRPDDDPLSRCHRRHLWRHMPDQWPGRPDFIAYDVKALTDRDVAAARRRGIPVLTWTVSSEFLLHRARKLADNVIFEQIRP